jgi:hypothetical protein
MVYNASFLQYIQSTLQNEYITFDRCYMTPLNNFSSGINKLPPPSVQFKRREAILWEKYYQAPANGKMEAQR